MLSGKFRPGPGIMKLLEPGRICSKEKNCCGWIVVRRRRKQYYVYLQTPAGEDCYLGSLTRFEPSPVKLVVIVDGENLDVDIESIPDNAEGLIGVVKSLAQIYSDINLVKEVIARLLSKYKLVEGEKT